MALAILRRLGLPEADVTSVTVQFRPLQFGVVRVRWTSYGAVSDSAISLDLTAERCAALGYPCSDVAAPASPTAQEASHAG